MATNEQNLVDDLVSTNNSINPAPLNIIVSNVSTKSRCDLEFIGAIPTIGVPYYFCLEVKSDKSSSEYNNVLLFYGDILKNRKLMQKQNLPQTYIISYGVLLEYDENQTINSFFIKQIQQYINAKDWDDFGIRNECTYIFFLR